MAKRTYPHTVRSNGFPARLSRQTNSFLSQKQHEQDGLHPAICLPEAWTLLHCCGLLASSLHVSHVFCWRAASVGCQERPPHASRKHPLYPYTAETGCTLRGHVNICLWGALRQSGLTTNQASLTRQQGQVAKPQLPSPSSDQPYLSFPISHHFLVLLSHGGNNFLLECLSLHMMSSTFLGMSGEEL